ncbi:MAG: class I SAM-dependent methyltransferase [Chloroflexi bacterium]|nr:MAG: class I SAM-dependent methyltransferase [Chloroflexota bacterium]
MPTEIPTWLRQRAEAYARHPLVRRPVLRSRFARFAGVKRDDRVLDVGTGPGYNAFALAAAGAVATAVDWRPELLEIARAEAKRRRLGGLTFLKVEPASLPFDTAYFDVVTSAGAVHHFASPQAAIAEMARVCRSGGHVVLEDVVASEQPVRARYYNRLERLRDRSHQRLLPLSEVVALLGQAALLVRRVEVQPSLREFNEWLGVSRPPYRRSERIRHLLQGSVEQDLSGLEVQPEDDTFLFVQQLAWLLAEKPG